MTLLTEIQEAAVDPSHQLSDLLRKSQILAFRLAHDPFKQWVGHELNGYPTVDALPPYRASLRGDLRAHLSGPFGSSVSSSRVPISLFANEHRDALTRFDFTHSVASLESIVEQARAARSARSSAAVVSRTTPPSAYQLNTSLFYEQVAEIRKLVLVSDIETSTRQMPAPV